MAGKQYVCTHLSRAVIRFFPNVESEQIANNKDIKQQWRFKWHYTLNGVAKQVPEASALIWQSKKKGPTWVLRVSNIIIWSPLHTEHELRCSAVHPHHVEIVALPAASICCYQYYMEYSALYNYKANNNEDHHGKSNSNLSKRNT